MPWFEQLQKQYGPKGFQVIGVAMDDAGKEDIAKFAKESWGRLSRSARQGERW
jgi:hypothetical protein